MKLLLIFLAILVLPVAATLLFKARVAYRIANDVLRIITVGAFYLAGLLGFSWACIPLAFNAFWSDLYPTSTHPIDDTYYFTQQEYGFATIMSRGYDLTFYRQRPFWLDQKLGSVQLECSGKETVWAAIVPAHGERIRLRLVADNQQRLDTLLSTTRPFDFRRTFEDRTLDWAHRR